MAQAWAVVAVAIVGAFHALAFAPSSPALKTQQLLSPGKLRWRVVTRAPMRAAPDELETQLQAINAAPSPLPRKYSSWTWKGHTINYRKEDGRNPPSAEPAASADAPQVLLVHGFGASVNHFRKTFPGLVDMGFTTHAVDLLGFGASDKPTDLDYDLELWRDMLSDYMDYHSNVKDQKWIVMGNSIGGLLTLMMARDRPDKVAGAVLFNAAGGLTSFRSEELPFYARPLWWFLRTIIFGDVLGPLFFENFRSEENVRSVLNQVYSVKDAVDDELVNILLEPGQDPGATEVFLKVMRADPGPSPESCLRRITCPVLAIWGKDDPWTPLDRGFHPGTKFPEYSPVCELRVLADTGHCLHDERPHEVQRLVAEWMTAKKLV